MRTPLAFLAALCLMAICKATTFDPLQGPKPIAVLIQSDPWLTVMGSDMPRVAIYENGEVIFARQADGGSSYRHLQLDKGELEKVRAKLQPVLALGDLKPEYDIQPGWTDQPIAQFYLRDGQREMATSVYGLTPGRQAPAFTQPRGGPAQTMPPAGLLELHRWLCELDFTRSEEWTPRYIEVMFWDYSYAPDASIHWPKNWPSLTSDRAIRRGDSYSVFLDAALLPKLRDFLATENKKGAVEIDGKKMAASYRYAFPGERTWRKALDEAFQRGRDDQHTNR